jgi:hypothetical protein
MGGFVPLGYDARDRKLHVNDAEAALVCRIFEGFVETESGTKLVQALRSEGHLTKRDRAFTKSDVYRVLSNRTYLGEATMGEDRCRIRINPGVFARLRSFAFNILKANRQSSLSQDRYRAAIGGLASLINLLQIPER